MTFQHVSDAALSIAVAFIATREGFVSHPYEDLGGVWTIGYGFVFLPDGTRVSAATPPMTRDQADTVLAELVGRTLEIVREMVYVAISHNQAAALCSFAYNGTATLRVSPILGLLNERNTRGAACHFKDYVFAGGKRVPGLVQRRADECALFLTPDAAPVESAADALNDAELEKLRGAFDVEPHAC